MALLLLKKNVEVEFSSKIHENLKNTHKMWAENKFLEKELTHIALLQKSGKFKDGDKTTMLEVMVINDNDKY